MKRVIQPLVPMIALLVAAPPSAYAKTAGTDDNRVTVTQVKSHPPSATAHIQKYEIEEAPANSGYDTGNLRITYDDGRDIIDPLPLIHKTTKDMIYCDQIGFADTKLAGDKRTIGWSELINGCFSTYSIPIGIGVYRSGRTVLHISQGQAVWFWMFLDGGKHIAGVWGPTHGAEVGDYQLYDAATGKVISEIFGNPDTQSLAADAPEWAKQTEHAMHQ